jgi:hypothetical protein
MLLMTAAVVVVLKDPPGANWAISVAMLVFVITAG